MVTVSENTDLSLPWDYFLQNEVEAELSSGAVGKEVYVQNRNLHIQGFRQTEWKAIVRELKLVYNWIIPDDLEPHWVAPGKAILWQEQITSKVQSATDADGKSRRAVVESNEGWTPTSRLSANNASAIAQYLSKGLRFRPPEQGKGVEVYYQENSASLEGSVNALKEFVEQQDRITYVCDKHPDKGTVSFTTWKTYLRHCRASGELPDLPIPEEVQKRAKKFKWYCTQHNQGFNNERLAYQHMRVELRKPGRALHATVKQMEVKKRDTDDSHLEG